MPLKTKQIITNYLLQHINEKYIVNIILNYINEIYLWEKRKKVFNQLSKMRNALWSIINITYFLIYI